MPSIPAQAPRFTLNLIDGDQRTLRLTVRNKATKAPLDLTDWVAALQVRKAFGDAAVILTLATADHPDFTSSDGCSITILNQTDAATKGKLDLFFDLIATELVIDDFTAETEAGQLTGRRTGLFDLELTDDGGQTEKYARGTAVFRREVTEPAAP